MTKTQKPIEIKREREARALQAEPPAEHGWEPFVSLRREINHLFDEAGAGWPFGSRVFDVKPWTRLMSVPPADIEEGDDSFVLSLDVPGMDEKGIKVKLTDGAVTISGEKTEEKTEEKKDYRLCERRHGSFTRSFTLPDSVDPDKVSASYEKGVLKLTMPKSAKAKEKQRVIEVKAA